MNAESVLQMCRSSGVDVYWDGGDTLQVFGRITPRLSTVIKTFKPAIIAYFIELEYWSLPIVRELMWQMRKTPQKRGW